MNDEQYFLANAYVDGELTADERRIAEADPEVMSEVEQFRALQAEMRAVEPSSAEARHQAIDAALAEFDRVADVPPAPAVVPFRPRPAYARYLGVAAAVVAVVGIGVVVSQVNLGGDDDDSAAIGDVADEPADEPAADIAESEAPLSESFEVSGDAAAEDAATDDDAAGDDAAASGAEATAEMAADEPADEAAEEAADEPAAADDADTSMTAARVAIPDDFDADAPLTNEIELAVYGAYLLQQRDAGTLGSTPNENCLTEIELDDGFEILGDSTFVADGQPRPIHVVVQEFDGVVSGIDADTCGELVVSSFLEP